MKIRDKRKMKLLTWTLDPDSVVPMYEQLCHYLRLDIQTNVLEPGKLLPSRRLLAEHLAVSVNTVENAYSQMMAEGYIESRSRQGYYVRRLEAYDDLMALRRKFKARMADSAQLHPRLPRPVAASEGHSIIYDFTTNQVDMASFPFTTWARLSRQVLQDEDRELLKVSPPQGDRRLRASIAQHLLAFRGMDVNPEQIIIGAGSEYLFSLLIQLLGPGKQYVIENPGYTKIGQILERHGAKISRIDVDRYGMEIDPLMPVRQHVFYVTPSHQFPTGVVMPIKRRERLLNHVEFYDDSYIIEDDYDSEFRFSGRPIPAMQSMDRKGKVIYLGTFSRSLAPSMRISYMVLPLPLLNHYRQTLMFYASTVSRFEQVTLAHFIDGGYFERHLNKMRKIYRERRDILLAEIEQWSFRRRMEISGVETGLHLVLAFHSQGTEPDLIQAAAKANVRVHGLSEYSYNNPNPETTPRAASKRLVRPPTLILGYAHLTPEELVVAAERLHQAWAGLVH